VNDKSAEYQTFIEEKSRAGDARVVITGKQCGVADMGIGAGAGGELTCGSNEGADERPWTRK
jgi:hypothetical protein